MVIYLIRHGSTIENESGVLQGQRIGGQLSPTGIYEVLDKCEKLKKTNINYIVYSDLNRSEQTARIIGTCLNISSYIPTGLLRERDVHNKESNESLLKRATILLNNLVRNTRDCTLLLVGHCDINNAILIAGKEIECIEVKLL